MSYGYESDIESERHWIGVLLVGAVVGSLVVGLAWVGTWWLASPEPESRQEVVPSLQAVDEPTAETETTEEKPSEATTHLGRCQTVHDAQSAALQTAADSLTQWEVHIGAMNKLVVGAITLKQARQFWSDTRVGAHAKLHDFAAARGHYNQRIFRCPAPRRAAEKANPALGICHRAVAARGETVHLATIALGTWEQHVHHMDMLRSGEMTAQQASRRWLRTWPEGDREVRAYRAATRSGKGLIC